MDDVDLGRFLVAFVIVALTATVAGLWVGSQHSPRAARPLQPRPAVPVDLYGNPVSPAIAPYRIDASGAIEGDAADVRVGRLRASEG